MAEDNHLTPVAKSRYIAAKESLINRETALTILQVVLQDAGWSGVAGERLPDAWHGVVLESRSGTDVNLDALAGVAPDTLSTIYNIVRARVAVLSAPAARPVK
jgi:hypothetical protein